MIIAILGVLTVLAFVFDIALFMKWDTIMRAYRKRLRSRYKPFEYYGVVCDKCKEPGRVVTRKVMNGRNHIKVCERLIDYKVFFKYYGNRVYIDNEGFYHQVRIGDKIKLVLYKYKGKIKIVYFEKNNRPPK